MIFAIAIFVCTFLLLLALIKTRKEIPSPIVSGEVVDGGLFLGRYVMNRSSENPKSWVLNEDQLRQVSLWLEKYNSDWGLLLGTPPPPSFSIALKRANGNCTQIDMVSINENWIRTIVIWDSNSKKNGIINITAQERENLLHLVKEK